MGWLPANFKTDSARYVLKVKKDRQATYHTLQQDINVLSAELCRLTRLPYSTRRNFGRIRTIDAQIAYLEELLAAYERDQKKHE